MTEDLIPGSEMGAGGIGGASDKNDSGSTKVAKEGGSMALQAEGVPKPIADKVSSFAVDEAQKQSLGNRLKAGTAAVGKLVDAWGGASSEAEEEIAKQTTKDMQEAIKELAETASKLASGKVGRDLAMGASPDEPESDEPESDADMSSKKTKQAKPRSPLGD
ncbi:MAG: hypothetical protein KBD64_00405 [Gammaproteobacteria bacterium]|nr:hypothetical protein [Gammaproteobacteria bacterium]